MNVLFFSFLRETINCGLHLKLSNWYSLTYPFFLKVLEIITWTPLYVALYFLYSKHAIYISICSTILSKLKACHTHPIYWPTISVLSVHHIGYTPICSPINELSTLKEYYIHSFMKHVTIYTQSIPYILGQKRNAAYKTYIVYGGLSSISRKRCITFLSADSWIMSSWGWPSYHCHRTKLIYQFEPTFWSILTSRL